MGHYYRFKLGDPVVILPGRYERHLGVVDSAVFQRTVDVDHAPFVSPTAHVPEAWLQTPVGSSNSPTPLTCYVWLDPSQIN